MAANHWQSAAAEYAAREMEGYTYLSDAGYTYLSDAAREEIARLIAAAFRAGALAGFDRAEEIRREVMGK